jgi:hypothetical protein
MLNQARAIQFMVQRGGSTRTKNQHHQSPLKIATIRKNKQAKKAIRLVETRQYHRKVHSTLSNPYRDFRIHLYDWLQERYDCLLRRFHHVENHVTHRISSNDLRTIIVEEGFTQITDDDLNDLIIRHETDPNEIDYQTFLSGKLYIDKAFLLSTFISKKKKKKKKNTTIKSNKQNHIPIATLVEDPQIYHEKSAQVYVKQHQFVTDKNRFTCNRIPDHYLVDDSMYYIDQSYPQRIHIHNAGRSVIFNKHQY